MSTILCSEQQRLTLRNVYVMTTPRMRAQSTSPIPTHKRARHRQQNPPPESSPPPRSPYRAPPIAVSAVAVTRPKRRPALAPGLTQRRTFTSSKTSASATPSKATSWISVSAWTMAAVPEPQVIVVKHCPFYAEKVLSRLRRRTANSPLRPSIRIRISSFSNSQLGFHSSCGAPLATSSKLEASR